MTEVTYLHKQETQKIYLTEVFFGVTPQLTVVSKKCSKTIAQDVFFGRRRRRDKLKH